MRRGFKFNSKHSYSDFKMILEKRTIYPPNKKKIKEDVPFMNGIYDFSTVGTNGEIVYGERQIFVSLGFMTRSKELLAILFSSIFTWLMDSGKQQLIFDDIADYYFLAEVEEISNLDEFVRTGKLEIKFIAEPFKYGVNLEGSDIWDTFNFETDVLQDTEFDVVDTKTVNIINVGRSVIPTINVDATMSVILNSKTYNLSIGDNKLYDFMLWNGDNSIIINGTGHIKFIFRKQTL